MKKIGLLSDTHSYLDSRILHHLRGCDEIWHAGDFGTAAVAEQLAEVAPLRGVYGNIDGRDVRLTQPLVQSFELEGLKVLITHIGGYPGRYSPAARTLLQQERPGLFISGHSHILKVMPDPRLRLLHLNPGAAGRHGFHNTRTLLRFEVAQGKVQGLQVVELGPRTEAGSGQ
ncbi:metallophosphatase family protein [Hymenobacter sp. BT175]|uniref:metallophosphoesterase family protein n=1 Tax=Hymenobacter translucens TaxID=2886507 RepID=UPI001D0F3EE4|nr:metallophosphoesterase family protein [Hymenobacter translucens]MCC2546712.1 metallophosphatase family protein [Hymenobacter translucens]